MIDWQTVKEFFGFGTKPKVVRPLTEGKTKSRAKPLATTRRPAPPPAAKPINARNYYRRNGRYYSSDDDSIIEDAILLLALVDLYDAGEIFEQEAQAEHWNTINVGEEAPTEDLLDIDVSDTPVESIGNSGNYTAPETPTYTASPEPEPVRQESYSSGYSDSGSSDCGSCD